MLKYKLLRNKKILSFFGEPQLKGEKVNYINNHENDTPRLFYTHKYGELWLGDSIKWLQSRDDIWKFL